MSEKETNAKGPKCRFSKLAIASALVVVLWALILYFRGVIVYPKSLRVLVWNIMSLVALIGFILGVVAIERIMRSKWA
ncbi:MAG: hypothetical protein ACE5HX_12690, partial [bacterium]